MKYANIIDAMIFTPPKAKKYFLYWREGFNIRSAMLDMDAKNIVEAQPEMQYTIVFFYYSLKIQLFYLVI